MWEGLFTPGEMARSVLWLAKYKQWTVQEQEMFEEKYFEFAPTRQLVQSWCKRFLETGNVLDRLHLGKYDKRKSGTCSWFTYPELDGKHAEREAKKWPPGEKAYWVFWYECTGNVPDVLQLYQKKYQKTVAPSEDFIQLWRLRFINDGRVVKEMFASEPQETTREVLVEAPSLEPKEPALQTKDGPAVQVMEPVTPKTPPPLLLNKSLSKRKIQDVSDYKIKPPKKIARMLRSIYSVESPAVAEFGPYTPGLRCNSRGRVTPPSQNIISSVVKEARMLRLRTETRQMVGMLTQKMDAEAAGKPPPPEEPVGQTCLCMPKRLAKWKLCTKRGPHYGQACYVCAEPAKANPCAFLMWDPEDPKYYKCKNYYQPLTKRQQSKLYHPTPETSGTKFLEWE